MKVFLMHKDHDLDLGGTLPPQTEVVTQDLELGAVLAAMAAGDQFLLAIARRVLLCSLADPREIAYRQDVLADVTAHPDVVRDVYDLAVAAIAEEKQHFFPLTSSPDSMLYRSVQVLEMFAGMLKRLRAIAETYRASFGSAGFTRFFAMIAEELDDDYLRSVDEHLKELGFPRGTLISAAVGQGVKGRDYVLRKPKDQGWRGRMPLGRQPGHSFYIPDRDENGYRMLSELRSRGLNGAVNAVAQSNDHILGFFAMLRAELAFYIGCLNLRENLTARGAPACTPVPWPEGTPVLSARGLCDASLALHLRGGAVVGNDLDADGKTLIMITGANQGGKSTFLRSLGQAQLMMQAGMFVAAQSFAASTSTGVFTHFKREEDAAMDKGKLDEELDRMSIIIDQVSPGALLLANESFASTNEREGSEIARQVIRALTEDGIRIVFVTHQHDLAGQLYAQHDPAMVFLRAERRDDGHRTFRLPPGEPLPTSYGQDLYQQIFHDKTGPVLAGTRGDT
jgi:hypothetical protein